MDLLVTIAVISVLISILLPAVSKVRESTRRVICGSNMRQLGMGVSVFTNDNRERLPTSRFLPTQRSNASFIPSPERMDTIRLTSGEFPHQDSDELWDGLGLLVQNDYITAPNVFYCPSHHGNFQLIDSQDLWNRLDGEKEIVVNYLYRGMGPNGGRVLYNINPTAALVSDTLRSYEDLNHEGGFNILQAGLAVNWFDDVGDQISQDVLLRSGGGSNDNNYSSSVNNAWDLLDGNEETLDDAGDIGN